jgi:hypothetical protein
MRCSRPYPDCSTWAFGSAKIIGQTIGQKMIGSSKGVMAMNFEEEQFDHENPHHR